ncbi:MULTISPECIES: DNA (cytosine-5-)-methyltransferase [unclassified Mesorhizobium]|uniref:DNA cytosine methyltransferase n=1 Tax=unclassified Mesorhizobium TaxID=325217 RepID=UPI0010936EE0|nr:MULTISPECIES: DNA (cytosine-5-)-methyltransferase [unclassified Mesorhizobium]TGS46263.1 DNA (cytosine-5-)-methyltransferase [Mesorhizobium sp. M8A.F.Ca.ET.182.01.1.1]TGS81721.1 DNA (cytosine-5-)-methyltransferase [Mesorhizobium sp. M8A.F.Ca.ET.181.01.1.1]
MDFNETQSYENVADGPEGTGAAPADTQSARLHAIKERVRTRQKAMTKAFLDIASELNVARTELPESKLKAFLVSECGLNRSDLRTYLKFTEVLGAHRETIMKGAVSFATIKALVAAPTAVRDEVVEKISLGSFVASSDVAAVRRRHVNDAKDPGVEQERRRRKALRSAAELKAQSKVESFGEQFLPFAQSLIDFYNDGYDDTRSRDDLIDNRISLMQEAGDCLARFEELFDTAALPAAWEFHYQGNPDETVWLARAHDSLKSLALGEFQSVDSDSGNPYDTSHDFLDRAAVESVLWLFNDNGISQEQLKHRKLPASAAKTVIDPPYRLSSIEICAGAGGQALGLHAAGFDAVGIYEQSKNAVATLKANRALGPVRQVDIAKVDFTAYRGKIDLVAGGVPCQPHSSMGLQKGHEDKRDLFLEAVRIVGQVAPKAFFFENVEGFAFRANSAYRAELHRQFKELGYDTQVFSFLGCDYGLAQNRPRVAFVGFRDVAIGRFRMPPRFPEWRTTVGEALLDLVAANGWGGAEDWARKKANRIGPTIVGGSEQSGRLAFSANLRKQAWLDLGIDPLGLAKSAPSADHPKDSPFRFTMKMGARLQGFPDDWLFCGSQHPQKRQIGNALPPVMARAVGLAIYSALTGVNFDYEKALRSPLPSKHNGRLKLNMLARVSDQLDTVPDHC